MAQSNVSFDEIADIVETDPSISFKLLRFISSSDKSKRAPITTVKNAISYLGLYEIRKFIALIAIANLSEHSCAEIYNMALIRAKFCEYMELSRECTEDSSKAYLTGMLSMIAAILKTSPENIVPKLPISKSMQRAILNQDGELGCYVKICTAYETGNFQQAELLSPGVQLNMDQVGEAYHHALQWQAENPINALI